MEYLALYENIMPLGISVSGVGLYLIETKENKQNKKIQTKQNNSICCS